jgi:hypothetical protein
VKSTTKGKLMRMLFTVILLTLSSTLVHAESNLSAPFPGCRFKCGGWVCPPRRIAADLEMNREFDYTKDVQITILSLKNAASVKSLQSCK